MFAAAFTAITMRTANSGQKVFLPMDSLREKVRGTTPAPIIRACATALLLSAALAGCAAGPRIDDRHRIDTTHRSLNHESRVRYLILHFTWEGFEDSLKVLTRGNVSSHYLIDEPRPDGSPPSIYRLVDEDRRAWHAGVSFWAGETMLNSASVGIEIVNLGDRVDPQYAPYPAAQVDAVVALVRDIQRRHAIKPHRILGHNDIAPQRKTDPGPKFPWRRLADEGLIPWPDEAAVDAARPAHEAQLPPVSWFQERLATIGYPVPRHGELDAETRRVLMAFQMKYRPSAWDGTPDAATAALLEVVARPGGLLLRDADGRQQPYTP
jgi:N-acetylmuramoyl-L-alanine amidase